MELATALIWTLRIVLPVILFWIYFKLQSPKDDNAAGPTANCYTRSELLEHRRSAAPGGDPAPESLAGLTLRNEAEAPTLFIPAPAAGRARGGRRPAGESRASRERAAEKREPREPCEPREARSAPEEMTREVPAAEESPAGASAGGEDEMHLESLLNYVAFNRKEQQRTFLIDEEDAPPPPPRKKAAATAPALLADVAAPPESGLTSRQTATSSRKANAEAQMVLRGSMNFKRSDVAKELYEQLVGSDVEISEQTYALLIEACILAKDLKHASDFLMKMEAKGYSPDMELLDKVMDLYSVQKVQREQEKLIAKAGGAAMQLIGAEEFAIGIVGMDGQWAPDDIMASTQFPMAASVEGVLEEMRPKLSSAAAIYVPMPDCVDPPLAAGEEPRAKTPLSVPHRSALCVRAKPFQPVQDVVCDSKSYTTRTVNSLEGEGEGAELAKPFAKGKGKGSGKSGHKKCDSESKDTWKKATGTGDGELDEKRQEARSASKNQKNGWKEKRVV